VGYGAAPAEAADEDDDLNDLLALCNV
jgi:hypothetical protein